MCAIKFQVLISMGTNVFLAMYFLSRIALLSAIQGHVTLKVGVVSKDHMILSTFKLEGILPSS